MSANHSAALAAYEAASLGYSVNSEGYLLFYALGVIKLLGDIGLVGPSTTFAATGTSSLISAAVCSKAPYDVILRSLRSYWGASQDSLQPVNIGRTLLRKAGSGAAAAANAPRVKLSMKLVKPWRVYLAADDMLPPRAHVLCSQKAYILNQPPWQPWQPSNTTGSTFTSSSSSGRAQHSKVGSEVSIEMNTSATGGTTAKESATKNHTQGSTTGHSTSSATPVPQATAQAGANGRFPSRSALLDAIVDSSFPKAAKSAAPGSKAIAETSGVPVAVQLVQQLGVAAGAVPVCPVSIQYCVRVTAVPPLRNSSSGRSSIDRDGASASPATPVDNRATAEKTAPTGKKAMAVKPQHTRLSAADVVRPATAVSNLTAAAEIALQISGAAATAAAPAYNLSVIQADIYPGLSQHLAIDRSEWLSYMVAAPSIQVLSYMHYMGRVDAYAWANSTGLVKAATAEQQKQLTARLLQRITSINEVDALFRNLVDWPGGKPAAGP